jgi:integrase
MTPINNQGVCYGNHQQTRSLEQGKARRPEATPQAERHLGDPHLPPECAHAVRDLAMFNLAIDSKLRGCDLVSLRVRDITHGNQVLPRAMVIQRKTQRPVQFELTEPTRAAVSAWLEKSHLRGDQFLFPSRVARSPHVSTRQYARIVHHWAESAGLDSSAYGTHSMRRTKATLIYKRTKNLRAVQLLLGHSKLESTVRYLGIEVDDALEISEQTEI